MPENAGEAPHVNRHTLRIGACVGRSDSGNAMPTKGAIDYKPRRGNFRHVVLLPDGINLALSLGNMDSLMRI